MNTLQIIANKVSLDTYEDINISLNYQIDDILNLEKRNTNWSKSIFLPGTPKNNLFFKQMFDVNVDSINFNPSKAISCSLRIGTNTLMNGKLQLLNVLLNNGEVSYEIMTTGQLKNILLEFGENTLRKLDYSKYNHIRNKANINNSGEFVSLVNGTGTDLTGYGRGYYYPYIINGESTQLTYHSYIYNLFPAMFAYELFVDSLDSIGYTYTSNFLDNQEYFRRLILPYTDTMIQMDDETFNERKVITGINDAYTYYNFTPYREKGTNWWYNDVVSFKLGETTAAFTRESGTVDDVSGELTFRDDLSQWTNDIFTCDVTGKYDVNFNGQVYAQVTRDDLDDVEYLDGSFELRYYFQVLDFAGNIKATINPNIDDINPYGVVLFGLPTGGPHTTPWTVNTDQTVLLNISNILLEAGDKVRVNIGFRYPSSINWTGITDNQIKVRLLWAKSEGNDFAKFEVIPSSNQSLGNEIINMNAITPDIKMKDYFLAIVKMFNLIIVDNPNKENDLIIEPRDDYFKTKEKVIDWTYKLDKDSEVKITPMSELDAKTYLFTYEQDDDYYNKLYTDSYQETYGQLSLDVINDFSINTSETKLLFASTPNADFNILDRSAPFFCDKDDEAFQVKKVKPRILFAGGKINCLGYVMFDHPEDSSPLVMETYNYVGMYDHPRIPTYDLGFWPTQAKYFTQNSGAGGNTIPMLNLYNQFHKATLNNIIDPNARLMDAKFWLTPKDIAEFDFRDIVFIDGAYWRVQNINDFDPVGSENLTQVILYKLIDLNIISRYLVRLPVSNASCPYDVVGFKGSGKGGNYYASASGLEMTEDCCSSLGGNWANGTCYVSASTPTIPSTEASPTRFRLPIDHGYADDTNNKDANSNNSSSVKVQGVGNYVAPGAESTLVLGNNNTINSGIKSSIVIGSNIVPTKNNTVYIGNIVIDEDGNISNDKLNVIRAGTDTVMEFNKTNFIDIIRGGTDVVRGIGGDSKNRPIINGSDDLS